MAGAEKALVGFVSKVNHRSHEIAAEDISQLRHAGWGDAQIAEVIHIVALFAMYNRVANSFGLASQGQLALYESQQKESRR